MKICDECETVAHCTKHGCIPKVSSKDLAMRFALEALEESLGYVEEEAENAQRLYGQYPTRQERIQGLKDDVRKHMEAITALQKALAEQPKFTKHTVEQTSDWSEWVCPDPKGYLMKCCDCGLVHETQFGVAKYKPNSTEDCDMVDDPNLQAIFRMRRSEEQPAQQEPVAEAMARYLRVCSSGGMPKKLLESVQGLVEHAQRLGYFKAAPQPAQQEPAATAYFEKITGRIVPPDDTHRRKFPMCYRPLVFGDTTPPARKPLSVDEIFEAIRPLYSSDKAAWLAVNHSKDEYRAIEAKHGIKENT